MGWTDGEMDIEHMATTSKYEYDGLEVSWIHQCKLERDMIERILEYWRTYPFSD